MRSRRGKAREYSLCGLPNFRLDRFSSVILCGVTLTLPDIPSIPEADMRLELACGLYASRKVARGVAAGIAGMDHEGFEKELESRGITNGYSVSDLDADLKALEHLLAR